MKLNVKILIIFCAIFLAMVVFFYSITTRIILGSFEQLEEKNIQTDLKRALNVLDKDMSGLKAIGGDWGAWDETRDFLTDLNRKYMDTNLTISTAQNLNINYFLFLNASGELVYSAGFQFGDDAKEMSVPEELIKQIRNQKSLTTHKNAKDSSTGIVVLPDDIVVITAWAISNNEMNGPVSGTIVMGRAFDENETNSLAERTQLKVALERMDNNDLPDDFDAARIELSRGLELTSDNTFPDIISGYSFLKDISGKDSLILKVSTPRAIYKQGKITTTYFLLVQFIVGIILIVALFLTIQYTVLRPILKLKKHALSVGKSGDLSARLSLKSRDEIGALSREFDGMLEQLSDVRKRLIEQSYYSGIGEMASGILHNIRNILTPLVGQLANIRTRLNEAPLNNMEQAITELTSDGLEQGRENSLKRYLSLAMPKLKKINQDMDNGLMIVSGQVAHMEEVLTQQDKFSYFQKALEPLKINMIIQDATRMMPETLGRAVDIKIDAGISALPPVSAERVVLTQVLTNLLNNASESILRKGLQKGNIWITGSAEMEGDHNSIHVIIRDNGEGIDEDRQKQIFNRGVSTKTPKASGIGLHWCSNALAAIGAALYVESDGAGHGSSFHIKLPLFIQ